MANERFELQVRLDIEALRIVTHVLLNEVAPTKEARQLLLKKVIEAATDPRSIPSAISEGVEKAARSIVLRD